MSDLNSDMVETDIINKSGKSGTNFLESVYTSQTMTAFEKADMD